MLFSATNFKQISDALVEYSAEIAAIKSTQYLKLPIKSPTEQTVALWLKSINHL